MKIGIIELSISECGKVGYYNNQEIGLGKELSKKGHCVHVYKCVPFDSEPYKEKISNINVHYINCKALGSNSLINVNKLDKSLDAIVCSSDTQLSVPTVYKWAKKNGIIFIPYVGTINSTSKSRINRLLINIYKRKLIKIYKKCTVIAKTNAVKNELNKCNIDNVVVGHVGLDFDSLNKNYKEIDIEATKKEYGFTKSDKIVLLVGRLEEDRSPLDCVEVFEALRKSNSNYKLMVVGKGSLENELYSLLQNRGMSNHFVHIKQIDNSEMYKVYSIADRVISFNKHEIFGMSILEAMYYEKPVFAIKAPGPSDIIIDNKTGFLYDDYIQMSEDISEEDISTIGEMAHQEIIKNYTWSTTSNIVNDIITKNRSV